jgi:hypothetical protein
MSSLTLDGSAACGHEDESALRDRARDKAFRPELFANCDQAERRFSCYVECVFDLRHEHGTLGPLSPIDYESTTPRGANAA